MTERIKTLCPPIFNLGEIKTQNVNYPFYPFLQLSPPSQLYSGKSSHQCVNFKLDEFKMENTYCIIHVSLHKKFNNCIACA